MDELTEGLLREGERLDELHRNGLMLIQNPSDFCFGIDAVLLSDFAKAGEGDRVVDLCSGNGVIPILMTAKTKAASFIGIEIQENSADMARRSTEINGLQAKLSFICGDIRDCADALPSAQFDVVTANPPYMNAGGGLTGSKTSKMTARHELCCSFDDVAATAARLLKYAGRFYLVHRPRRLADLFVTLRQRRLEPKTLRLVQPYRESEPNLALIEAVRGARPMLKILPTLIVYDGGGYTPELLEIYFGGGEAGGRKPQGLKTQTSGNFFEKKFPEPFKKL